jgi:sugar/nucleoside kinase (ribokinase family)
MTTYDVYAVGNALVDIQVQIEPNFLLEQALQKGVMTLVSAEMQAKLLRLLDGFATHTSSGGSACNTVVGVANLGGTAYYAGKVGDDVFGRFFQQELREIGVESGLPPGGGPTGTCLVMVTPDADRTFQTCLATSIELDEGDIDEEIIKQSKFVYVEGYLWDAPGPRRASLRAMEFARKHSKPVAYSYSDPFCVHRAKDDFRRLTKTSLDFVFCNEDEALALTGADDRMKALKEIASWGPTIFMTAGKDGAYCASGSATSHMPAFSVNAVDSNGAGDLFAGGVLYGLAHGLSHGESAVLGSYAAALVVTQLGPRLAVKLAGRMAEILAIPPGAAL